MSDTRRFDIVLFGGTGFTGGLTAEYLARHAPADLRWALAGRTRAKLEALRERLAAIRPAAADLELLIADVEDPASLKSVVESARVVITTVGPYALHGGPLVAACAEAGTDYVDLTGEPEFVDRTWLQHQQRAKETGARLVHCCGFDSIPHDLGAYFTVQQLPEGVPLKVEGFVRANATFSAGTFHSAVNAFGRGRQTLQAAKQRRAVEKRDRGGTGRKVSGSKGGVRRAPVGGGWVAPLPTVDPQIVLRSARAIERYGPEFSYGHYMSAKRLATIVGTGGLVGSLLVLAQPKPLREGLLKLKASGDGPSPEKRARSWFRVRFVGEGGGRRVVTEVSGGDPGYDETAKMLAESGLCLALDPLPPTSGQVTTAQAMGNALIDRLVAAGITFRVLESS
jgi:short subunit dehydrogenase-like uncharacterized protein